MVCLGIKPGVAGWKAETNPLSYGGTQKEKLCFGENTKCSFCPNTQAYFSIEIPKLLKEK